MKFKIGNRVRVIGQEITGIVLATRESYNDVLIEEDSCEGWDGWTGWEEDYPMLRSVHKEEDLVRSEGFVYG
jgi:hypothetical protein